MERSLNHVIKIFKFNKSNDPTPRFFMAKFLTIEVAKDNSSTHDIFGYNDDFLPKRFFDVRSIICINGSVKKLGIRTTIDLTVNILRGDRDWIKGHIQRTPFDPNPIQGRKVEVVATDFLFVNGVRGCKQIVIQKITRDSTFQNAE